MSTQEKEQAEQTGTGTTVSSVLAADTVEGTVISVDLNDLKGGAQITHVADVGTVHGTLVGVRIGNVGASSPTSVPVAEKPPTGLAGLIARVRAWLARPGE